MLFHLRWSDIFDKSKVLLKPSVSVILYLPFNYANHNFILCPLKINDVQASPEIVLTASGQMMLCPADTNTKKERRLRSFFDASSGT